MEEAEKAFNPAEGLKQITWPDAAPYLPAEKAFNPAEGLKLCQMASFAICGPEPKRHSTQPRD